MASRRGIRRKVIKDLALRTLASTITETQRQILAALIRCMGTDAWFFSGWSEREIAEGQELPLVETRKHLKYLVELGLVERMKTPRVRYRASSGIFDPNIDLDFYEKISSLSLPGRDRNELWDWVRRDTTIIDLLRRARKKPS